MPHQAPSKPLPRSRGRRPRRRSGEGVVQANRKVRQGIGLGRLFAGSATRPFGPAESKGFLTRAGHCAFAHGLGELRHATLDDETIAGSVSEDSGSCTSSRDVSPAGKLRRRRRRERRLPTFVNLSNGNTPGRRGTGTTTASSPAASQGSETTDTQPSVSSRSTVAVDTYGFPASLEALSISSLSSADTEYFTHGGGTSSSSGNYQPATPTSMPLFEGFAHQARETISLHNYHPGRHRRSASASSAGAPPWSPAPWAPMPPQLAAARMHHPGRASFDGGAASSTAAAGLPSFEAFTPAYDGGGHRRNYSTSSSTGVGAWSPSVWSPTPQQLAVPGPQQRENGWVATGWQEGTLTVELVSRREPFLHYDGTDRSARR